MKTERGILLIALIIFIMLMCVSCRHTWFDGEAEEGVNIITIEF